MDTNEREQSTPEERGAELGRKAGRLFRNAGPRARKAYEEGRPKVQRLIQDNRPKMEQTGRDAARYAQEHQDEIKSLAIKGARMRLGPLGMALDALGIGDKQSNRASSEAETSQGPDQSRCRACQATNTQDAKFCNQCGARLASADAGRQAKEGRD